MTAAPTPRFSGWPVEAFDWFTGLAADNRRDWFHANRATYERAVRQPLESLLVEVEDEFGEGKVFRPNRDTRFSKDKTPYKTNVAALVGARYVELSADGLFLGGGAYHPERERLARLRAAIADERAGGELAALVDELRGRGFELLTDGALRTAPRGYPADHPRIDLLRQVHLAAGRRYAPAPWLHTAEAKDRIVEAWRVLTPLVRWIDAR